MNEFSGAGPSFLHVVIQHPDNPDMRAIRSFATVCTLARALEFQPASAAGGQTAVPDNDEVPFQEICERFVGYAARIVRANAGPGTARFSAAAWSGLERQLLRRLSDTLAPTFVLELGLSIMESSGRAERRRVGAAAVPGRHGYQRFVQGLLAGGLIELFSEYPVLARLLATITEQWIASTSELVSRLDADADEIGAHFAGFKAPLGEVKRVAACLSDVHEGGRSVIELEFPEGRRLMYKPRDLSVELAFAELVEWLNRRRGSIGIPLV